LFVTGASAVTGTAPVVGAFGATSPGVSRRAGLLEGLKLFGGEDPGELVFHFFFEFGDLFALVVGEFEFLLGEARDDVDATGRAGAVGTIAVGATGSATVFARRGWGGVGSVRGGGQRDKC